MARTRRTTAKRGQKVVKEGRKGVAKVSDAVTCDFRS